MILKALLCLSFLLGLCLGQPFAYYGPNNMVAVISPSDWSEFQVESRVPFDIDVVKWEEWTAKQRELLGEIDDTKPISFEFVRPNHFEADFKLLPGDGWRRNGGIYIKEKEDSYTLRIKGVGIIMLTPIKKFGGIQLEPEKWPKIIESHPIE